MVSDIDLVEIDTYVAKKAQNNVNHAFVEVFVHVWTGSMNVPAGLLTTPP